MKFMKLAIPAALLMIASSGTALAVNGSIAKTASPGVVVVTTGGVGTAYFNVLSANFPSGTLSKTKTLQGIDWTTTSYPNNPGETVELCYYRPYTANPVACHPIGRNSSGTDTGFNTQSFGAGSQVTIRHSMNGGPQPASPAGKDSVTIRYSY